MFLSSQFSVVRIQKSVVSFLVMILILCGATGFEVRGQEKVSLNGYLNDMQTIYVLGEDNVMWENLLHRRLNFDYYPTPWLNIAIQERGRFVQGNTFSKFPGYGDMMGMDAGWADLSFVQSGMHNDSIGWAYSMMLDRAYAEFSFGNFVATVGRQRINWGQTFAWNPNDIFNTYSYFDVDYPERPGSDAVRLQFYTGMTSSIEVAAKIDSANKVTGPIIVDSMLDHTMFNCWEEYWQKKRL